MANTSAAAPKKRKSISYEKWGYFFIAPFIIVFIVFQLVPLVETFYYSFFEKYTNSATWEEIEQFVGFKNYATIFSEGRIFQYLGNTMIMWVMGFLPQIAVPPLRLLVYQCAAPSEMPRLFQDGDVHAEPHHGGGFLHDVYDAL